MGDINPSDCWLIQQTGHEVENRLAQKVGLSIQSPPIIVVT